MADVIVDNAGTNAFLVKGDNDNWVAKSLEEVIALIKENLGEPYYGTLITLTNHTPWNDIEKYGEFDVTMKYKYKNKTYRYRKNGVAQSYTIFI